MATKKMTEEPKTKQKGKELSGTVVETKMNKTIVVEVVQIRRHPLYRKTMRKTKRFFAHYEGNALHVGDHVTISEVRPISKLKRFIVKG